MTAADAVAAGGPADPAGALGLAAGGRSTLGAAEEDVDAGGAGFLDSSVNVKSKRYSGASLLNLTLAVSCAGSPAVSTRASR